jgi:universal stress protein E
MRPIRKILVAVKDLNSRSLPEVAKAAQLAQAFGASLEIFHAIATPVYVDLYTGPRADLRRIEREQLAENAAKIEKIAERTRRHGITVRTHVDWDYPSHEAILRRAKRTGAGLIVVHAHEGSRGIKWLMRSTDWELLKLSPLPVLLVRTPRAYLHPTVLAAVDPTHAHDKPARLDTDVLLMATRIATAFKGSAHAVHAFISPSLAATAVFAQGVTAPVDLGSDAAAERRAVASLKRAVSKFSIPAQRRHVVAQHPIDAIPGMARKLKSHIVVMGALSRSGIKRIFIGNTAEQILDAVPCDVLIVRPPKIALKKIPNASAGMALFSQPLPY